MGALSARSTPHERARYESDTKIPPVRDSACEFEMRSRKEQGSQSRSRLSGACEIDQEFGPDVVFLTPLNCVLHPRQRIHATDLWPDRTADVSGDLLEYPWIRIHDHVEKAEIDAVLVLISVSSSTA
jgi:hypothetical protein